MAKKKPQKGAQAEGGAAADAATGEAAGGDKKGKKKVPAAPRAGAGKGAGARSAKKPGVARKPEKGKAAAAKKPAKPKAPPRARPTGARIELTCSECYEEFSVVDSHMGESVTCPECLHVGKRPKEDFLKQVETAKGREKKLLVVAAALVVLLGVFGLAAVMMLSPHHAVFTDALGADTAGYAILGGLGLVFVIGLVLAIQYERNRWEVYF